jgi:membrane protein
MPPAPEHVYHDDTTRMHRYPGSCMVPDTQTDPSAARYKWRSVLTRLFRVAVAVGREIADGQLSLHAMSLVYTTLLSLVPLLAVSFSVLKAFGVHNQIEPLLSTLLAPLGAQGAEITGHVIGFVENMKVGVLGAVGLSLLFYTVVSLIQKIEAAFNFAWRVAQPRPLAQRFSQYLSVLMVGPILVFSAVALTGTLLSSELASSLLSVQPLGMLVGLLGKLLPYVLVIAAFTFIYVFIPNTRVQFGSALLGATVAGLIWQTGGWAFGSFIASSSQYTAIYASFAIVILFMIWLYLSWLVLLLGASIAFYFQHPEFQSGSREPRRLSACAEETLALWTMAMIGRAHAQGEAAWTVQGLAQQLGIPAANIEQLLDALERSGLLVHTADDPPHYLPAHALETITLKAVLDSVRNAGEPVEISQGCAALAEAAEACHGDIDAGIAGALHGRTVRDLVATEDAAVGREGP